MNISKIRKMAIEGDMSESALQYLLECRGECEHLDFKASINFSDEDGHDGACISKDIVGMKNVGGGYIIVGVKDKTWEQIGVTKEILGDTKMLRDKIRKYTGLEIETDIIHHSIDIGGVKKIFALILIRGPKNRNLLKIPSICQKSFEMNAQWGIRQGDTYIRDGDQTKRLDDQQKFYEFIENLESFQNNEMERALPGGTSNNKRSYSRTREEQVSVSTIALQFGCAAGYAFYRFGFKADVIEPLGMDDKFCIITPNDGTFVMTKRQFYETFPKVIETKSYRQGRLYHFPKPPERALKFRVK